MIGALDRSEIEQLLRTEQIGRLGIYGDGRVYVVPVAYGYDGAYVYIHSHEGLKTRLMRAHPEICFEIEEIVTPAHWRSVIAHGQFEELSDDTARGEALAVISRQGHQAYPPSAAPYVDGPDRVVVFRIRLTEITGRYEQDQVFPERIRR